MNGLYSRFERVYKCTAFEVLFLTDSLETTLLIPFYRNKLPCCTQLPAL